MIPTFAPSSAAARAARWPASPAPMTSTSCWGMLEAAGILCDGRGGAEGATQAVHGHDPPQPAVAVHRHERAEAPEALLAEQRLERLLQGDPQCAAVLVACHHRSYGPATA